MNKPTFNAALRNYVRAHLSPTKKEQALISTVYASVQAVLGTGRCIQIGSYPRFTAITPVHDLDVLYTLGQETTLPDPSASLAALEEQLRHSYVNPTKYSIRISRQTHSITIEYLEGKALILSVDIVPAYTSRRNEFGDHMYLVPELLVRNHQRRAQLYAEVARGTRTMTWIRSDPRGYIAVAAAINSRNEDFRKTVKFIKAWRAAWRVKDDSFCLKSFHIEQCITRYFSKDASIDIYDAIFRFFCDLPSLVERPQIPDRADSSRYIDDYLAPLSSTDRALLKSARDFFLITLENIDSPDQIGSLLAPGTHERASDAEEYLFDQKIPVLTEDTLRINATALERSGGFRERVLDFFGKIDVDRQIRFRPAGSPPLVDMFKWKVKNDNASLEPRGEITDHRTRNDPESTKYRGKHFVECFAIRNGTCIARARQGVVL